MDSQRRRRSPRLDRTRLRGAIQEAYRDVAYEPSYPFHSMSGLPLAELLGYSRAFLTGIPDGAVDRFAGVGNPFSIAPIRQGEIVLDLGCGAGMDALIASRETGRSGQVLGIDMTRDMIAIARQNAWEIGARNVWFEPGFAEAIPMPDDSVDVVLSNGVLHLCPDKEEVLREVHRVLKRDGRVQIADVLLDRPVPSAAKHLVHRWVDCAAGGAQRDEYAALIEASGFRQVEICCCYDLLGGPAIEPEGQAYGARGFNVRARK